MSRQQQNSSNQRLAGSIFNDLRAVFFLAAFNLLLTGLQSEWLTAHSLENTMKQDGQRHSVEFRPGARRPGESRGRRNSPVTDTSNPSRRRDERNVARRNLWLPEFNRRASNATTTTVAVQTQVMLGTPMIFPPGWQDSLLFNEQVEKLQKELENESNKSSSSGDSSTDINKANDLSSAGSGKSGTPFVLHQGSVLVSQKIPAELISMGHLVTVKPGAVAYVINLGKELAVYKLAGKRADTVSIKSRDGKHVFEVSRDTAVFITEATRFSEAKLSKFITCTAPVSMLAENQNQMHIFSATFSYLQALDHCPQFRNCLASKTPEKHALSERLLKLSAARLAAGLSP